MNIIKKQLSELLNAEMDRKDFLRNVGIGVVALTGLGTALKLLSNQQPKQDSTNLGYGGSAYGGDAAAKKAS